MNKYILILTALALGCCPGCAEQEYKTWKITTDGGKVYEIVSCYRPCVGRSPYRLYHSDGSVSYLSDFTVIEVPREIPKEIQNE